MNARLHCAWLLAAVLAACPLQGASTAAGLLVRSWQSEDGLPSNTVRAVAQAADGFIWVATAEGVVRFDGIRFSGFRGEPDALLAQRPPRALFALPGGDVWIASTRGGLLRWDGHRLHEVWEDADATVPVSRIVQVTQVVSDHGADALIERGDEVFRGESGGTPRPLEMTSDIAAMLRAAAEEQAQRNSTTPGGAPLALRDRSDRTWTAVPTGGLAVSQSGGPGEPVPLPGFGSGSRLTALLEDREGNLWAASGGKGLFQIRSRRVEVLSVAEGLSDRTAFALLEDQSGALWVGNKNGGIDRIAGGRTTHFEVGEGGANRPIAALCESRDGTLWAAARNGSVFRWQDGAFRLATTSAMPVTKVLAIVEDGAGRLWLGGRQGLAVWAGGALTRYGAEQGIPTQHVTALAIDAAGAVWAGTGDGSVFRGNGAQFERVGEPGALGRRAVSSLLPDAEGGVWITTLGAGLFRWKDGRFARFSDGEGLTEARLTTVLDDGAGHLWIGSLTGIFRVAKSELEEIASGGRKAADWLQLDRTDGLHSRECTGSFQPASWRARDGTLWFPTVDGIAAVHPGTLQLDTVAPPVAIEAARANGRLAEHGSAALRVGPGRSRLEFHYTALSFAAPEKVRFRVLLDGLRGSGWREAGGQRTAAFEAVPPGRYHFRVRASNGDGVWNETGASLAVEVLPHFWETAWFRTAVVALAAVLAATVGWSIARARMRGRLMRLELQTSREKERARIAQDLHDDLGASLTEISMLAHLAEEEETRGRDPLKEIAAKAHGLVGALDEIVWALNPRHDTLASLADYLAAFAAEFLDAAGIALRLDMPRELPALPLDAEQRHGLFLAVREALNNAVKHSSASEVRLRVSIDAGELKLKVEDNGRGLSAAASELSEGLRSMRERMTRIGGACHIASDAAGTSVCFSLPQAKP